MARSWDGWGWDIIYVYNGPSDSTGKFLGFVYLDSIPPLIESTAPEGDLTIYASYDKAHNASGWEAILSCYKPVKVPLQLTVCTGCIGAPGAGLD